MVAKNLECVCGEGGRGSPLRLADGCMYPHLQPCGEQEVHYQATEGDGEVHIC